jgi:hypothetical protein
MMQPMPYVYPVDETVTHMGHQYHFGPTFLVAPVFESATSRDVYLPQGEWVNFYNTSEEHTGPTTVNAAAPVQEHIPVFVKKNSVYLSGQIYGGNSVNWIDNYEAGRHVDVHAFPGSAGQSATFIYVDYLDNDNEKGVSVDQVNEDIAVVHFPAMPVPGTVFVYSQDSPQKVFKNGSETSDYDYDSGTRAVGVPFSANEVVTVQVGGSEVHIGMRDARELVQGARLVRTGSSLRLSWDKTDGAGLHKGFDISLYDMRGRCCWRRAYGSAKPGGASLSIPLSALGLTGGMYLLRVGRRGANGRAAKSCYIRRWLRDRDLATGVLRSMMCRSRLLALVCRGVTGSVLRPAIPSMILGR